MKLQFWWSKRDKIALEAMKAVIAKLPLYQGPTYAAQDFINAVVVGAFAYADAFLLARKGRQAVWVRDGGISGAGGTVTTWIYNLQHPENATPTADESKPDKKDE